MQQHRTQTRGQTESSSSLTRMAAGRGQFFLSLLQGLQVTQPGARAERKRRPCDLERAGRRRGESTKSEPVRPLRPPRPLPPSSTASTVPKPCVSYSPESYIERLPPEIILKIFSYLDADSLFCVGLLNRQFHKLANDNAVWYELYVNVIAKKWRPRLPESTADQQDVPQGFWKRMIFREMGCPKDTVWMKELRYIDPYTGLPAQTKQLLRSLQVGWEITLTFKGGQESVYKQNHLFFTDLSVTVCWESSVWPCVHHVSTLQVHGVIRPLGTTPADKPQWRSLINKIDVCRSEKWKFFGTDKLVKVMFFDGGIIVGVWRGTWKIAFVIASLHLHKLVERSLLGSLSWPQEVSPSEDEVDPHHRGRGYTVLVELHNAAQRILHQHYSPVLCERAGVRDGFVQLKLMHKHTPVLGRISLPWTAKGLQGDIQNCCILTLTVLDEAQRPYWCVSSSAALLQSSYDDEEFLLVHSNARGKVRMCFVWMQDIQQYFMTGLRIHIQVAK